MIGYNFSVVRSALEKIFEVREEAALRISKEIVGSVKDQLESKSVKS